MAGIISCLISLISDQDRGDICKQVRQKLSKIPYNGYLEIWQQRIFSKQGDSYSFESDDPICKIATHQPSNLWNNDWISDSDVRNALSLQQIFVSKVTDADPVISPGEVRLFAKAAYGY